tara:strand:- start:1465 stop:1776 length:312 start_codon:yes stop_codon:yes gene_type:complete
MRSLLLTLILFLSCNTCLGKDLIILGADWCPACIKLKNFIKDNPSVVEKFNVEIIDIDKDPETKNRLKVRLLPTSVIINDNNKVEARLEGYTKQNFINWLKKY